MSVRASFRAALTHRVKVVRVTPGALDAHGNATPTEESFPVTYPARVDFVSTDETLANRDEVLDRYMILLPADAQVDATDELVWLDTGDRLRVAGRPMRVDDRLGAHHLEVAAEKVTG